MREYKVNVTETVVRSMWVIADDPQDAIDIAEKTYQNSETLDLEFDVDPSDWRESDKKKCGC